VHWQRHTNINLVQGDDASRRRHGRVRCNQSRCNLGIVMDMSASGMRVLIKGRPRLHVGDVSPVQVEVCGGALVVNARVVWRSKVGWRLHIAGVQFVDLTPEIRRRLVELASTAANDEYIRDGIDPAARSA
jgi:hypothetical protein